MQRQPEVSVIIVTWNAASYIATCLESLMDDLKSIYHEIVLVDNASSDGTAELVQERFPRITLIKNSQNVGFARACNQALLAKPADYVLFLNPDTKVLPGAVGTLIEFMKNHPRTGAVGPTLLNPDGSSQLTGNAAPSLKNLFYEIFFLDRVFPKSRIFGRHKMSYLDRTDSLEVDWTMGACLMMRKSALDKVGAYDENFFLYFEETDLCLRLKKAGYQIYVAPQARVIHFGGGGPAHYTAKKIIEYHKSLSYFSRKYFTPRQTAGLRVLIFLRTVIRLLTWILLFPFFGDVAIEKLKGYKGVLVLYLNEGRVRFKNRLIRIVPKSILLPTLYYYKKITGQLEDELLMLEEIAGHCKCAVDIGANVGLYSYVLSKFCDRVEAFEPNPDCVESILAYNASNIKVHNVGLSSHAGNLILHIPIVNGIPVTGFASFEAVNGDQQGISVPVRQLDDYNIKGVSFIKIDVEGHESEVLEGARQTILRERPIILVEIEQRHIVKPIEMVFDQIIKLGYAGYFLQNRKLRPLSDFSYKVHQEVFLQDVMNKNYINDFIFKPCH